MMGIDRPLVSVIVPVYNGSSTIKRALQSIDAQSYPNIQTVIINNASTDDTESICLKWVHADPVNRKYMLTPVRGVSRARNMALDLATGEYFCFLDADDLLAPGFIETLVSIVESSGCGVASVGMRSFADGEELLSDVGMNYPVGEPHWKEASLEDIFVHTFIDSRIGGFIGNKLYSRNALGELRFDESLELCEDQDLLFRTIQSGVHLAWDDMPLYWYYRNSEGASHNVGKSFDSRGTYKFAIAAYKLIDLYVDRRDLTNIIRARLFKNVTEHRKALYYIDLPRRKYARAGLGEIAQDCIQAFVKCPYYKPDFKLKYLFWYAFAPVWKLKKLGLGKRD